MKRKNWKHALALGLALMIVLSTGVMNTGNWLHAEEVPATEASAPEAPAQGEVTVTEQIVVETKAPEETKANDPTEETKASDPTEETKASDPTEETKANDPTEETKASDPTEETKASDPTEETKVTDPTEETEATDPTEETDPTEVTEETQPELPAANIPITVTLVDPDDKELTKDPWTGTVSFGEGQTSASVELPDIDGYKTPDLTVSRGPSTTSLEEKAVYKPLPKTDETKPTEATDPTEADEETEPVLAAAELPITVTLADAEGNPVGGGTWTGTVAFAEGETTAEVTLPEMAGFTAPKLTVSRGGNTTALAAEAVYLSETAGQEEAAEATEETEPVLAAAELPITVTLADAEGNPVGEGTWTGTVAFAEEAATAEVTLPEIPGYTAPKLTVERTAETSALEAQVVYEAIPLEQQLNPNRSVVVSVQKESEILHAGDKITLVATLSGYDGVTYELQWRYSVDGTTWQDCAGENESTMTVELNDNNYMYYWNVLVTVTGVNQSAEQEVQQEAQQPSEPSAQEPQPSEEQPAAPADAQ